MTWPVSVVSLLQELIRIPSVNPEGDPGCSDTGESAIAAYVGELLECLGANVSFQEALPGRPNVLACFPSANQTKKRRLLFAPHLDTVSVGGMTIPPFSGEVRDGRIWGRGATDTKGSMAAMLWALYKCKDQISQFPWEIWFAGLVDEETRQMGSRKLAREKHFDFVVIGEPTNLQVIYKTKGSLWLKLRTRGLAAHGCSPEKGQNAILKMANILHWIQETATPRLNKLVHSDLGTSTVNVGMIHGGIRHNIVPDLCEVILDIRTIPGQNINGFKEDLFRNFPDLAFEEHESLPLDTLPDHPIIQKLLTMGARLGVASWFCDATSFAAVGIPAIALGPGSIDQAHVADEFLKISDLEQGADFFESFLKNLPS
jgi:acetylornithine deacetylase/succinyl-diaminopimelate desuccinylase-like protein